MRVFVDTNIILDAILERENFYRDSDNIVKLCKNKKIYGFLAAHTITRDKNDFLDSEIPCATPAEFCDSLNK